MSALSSLQSSSLPSSAYQPPMPSATSPLSAAKRSSGLSNFELLSQASDAETDAGEEPLKEAFSEFVGQTLFGSLLSTMRQSVGKPAYFHGGRTEEVFQQQMDQHLVESISEASAETVAEPMFELFQMQRRA
ncbi:rod-binding protein [Rhodopirellula sp. JC740]|uniref:Rod-binding protein n=1 Tax=Rhodopirellula halodulae TaxID=2894198 RepID=A0ABS8NG63_9BACT|nr:rod-binding protein [Rhodopirellula sp. JC740]MCC9642543.1 rod-binding protein [Rhodopirellula sp. JC740]